MISKLISTTAVEEINQVSASHTLLSIYNMDLFYLSSEECQILSQIRSDTSLREVALLMKRDVSYISRKLKNISEKTPLLIKVDRQWRLTPAGDRMNSWSKRAMREQRNIIGSSSRLKIGTTREFCNHVLSRSMNWLSSIADHLDVVTNEDGVESDLLRGNIDFGFDCGRPQSPQIATKKGPQERFVVAYSKNIKNFTWNRRSKFNFYSYPRLENLMPEKIGDKVISRMSFNDIAAVKSALRFGLGWSILPSYCLGEEIASEKIRAVPLPYSNGAIHFSVWWNREAPPETNLLDNAHAWLTMQKI